MEREISVGYVNGYVDASEQMSMIINRAIQTHSNNLLAVINDIINGLYIQRNEINTLVDLLNEQVETSPDMFDDYDEYQGHSEQITIEEILANMLGNPQNFILIKGGN